MRISDKLIGRVGFEIVAFDCFDFTSTSFCLTDDINQRVITDGAINFT